MEWKGTGRAKRKWGGSPHFLLEELDREIERDARGWTLLSFTNFLCAGSYKKAAKNEKKNSFAHRPEMF